MACNGRLELSMSVSLHASLYKFLSQARGRGHWGVVMEAARTTTSSGRPITSTWGQHEYDVLARLLCAMPAVKAPARLDMKNPGRLAVTVMRQCVSSAAAARPVCSLAET